MSLTVLSVAYPFAPVGRDAAGGAEQVLFTLDRALVAHGHRSLVLAQEGSETTGTLIPVPAVAGDLTEAARAEFRLHTRRMIERLLAEQSIDLVHFHGIDFPEYLPQPRSPQRVMPGLVPGTHDFAVDQKGNPRVAHADSRPPPPMLATLHLPPSWYPPEVFTNPAGPWLNPVSHAQAVACPSSACLLDPIENGVDVAAFQNVRHAKRGHALVLARICPEKGIHLAIDAARRAGVPLLIAGMLFPYPEHERYFREEIAPRLDARTRFVGPVGFARKRRLLSGARCLLVPSTAEETSSLVAREAIACGTPVVALRRGALSEAITHGETGWLAEDVEGLAEGIAAAGCLDPEICRETARRRFSDVTMAARYLALYERLAGARRRGAA